MEIVNALRDFTDTAERKIGDIAKVQRTHAVLLDGIGTLLTKAYQSETAAERKHREVFTRMLGSPDRARELKDVATSTPAFGGFAVPKTLRDTILSVARGLNPWLDDSVLGVSRVAGSDYKEPMGLADAAIINRSTETGSRTDSGTSSLREIAPAWGEFYSYCTISGWALQDLPSIEAFFVREHATQLAHQLASDIWNGSGTSGHLKGIRNTTPVTTPDAASPLRNATAVQYVPIVGATSPERITFNDIERLLSEFNDEYVVESNFALIMRASTFRSIVTGESPKEAPLLMPRNPTLFGIPVRFSSAVDAVGANNFPVAAGAWKRGYVLVDLRDDYVTQDQVTQPGFIKWRMDRRVGGTVRDNNAIKLLKFATS